MAKNINIPFLFLKKFIDFYLSKQLSILFKKSTAGTGNLDVSGLSLEWYLPTKGCINSCSL